MSRIHLPHSATWWSAGAGVVLSVLAIGALPPIRAVASASVPVPTTATGHEPQTPIKHFVYLMQAGRSFDNYFSGYPGADGPPAGTCQPVSAEAGSASCVKPFVLARGQGAPFGTTAHTIAAQIDGGRMDGFVSAFAERGENGAVVMGHLSRSELSFYWNTAQRYELFDHFFSSTPRGIGANRLYWVAAGDPSRGHAVPAGGYGRLQTIFDRLERAGVSWKFYVQDYHPAETYQASGRLGIETQTTLAPLVDFYRFTHDPRLASHIAGLSQYYRDLARGRLPAVSYIVSSDKDNERSAASVLAGERFISSLVTALMESHDWWHSAFLWSYDTSGGWFDHVRPPILGGSQLGLRVPALLVSPYVRPGRIDHQVLDPESALRFIESNWDLRPLNRRDATAPNLLGAFDFAARPRAPSLVPTGAALVRVTPAVVASPAPDVALVYGLYLGAAAAALGLLALAAALARRPAGLSFRRLVPAAKEH